MFDQHSISTPAHHTLKVYIDCRDPLSFLVFCSQGLRVHPRTPLSRNLQDDRMARIRRLGHPYGAQNSRASITCSDDHFLGPRLRLYSSWFGSHRRIFITHWLHISDENQWIKSKCAQGRVYRGGKLDRAHLISWLETEDRERRDSTRFPDASRCWGRGERGHVTIEPRAT
jgi:hypothetical protein